MGMWNNKGYKSSSILYAHLLDGKPHTIEEFYDRLAANITPDMAVRAYKIRRKDVDGVSLTEKVRFGKDYLVKQVAKNAAGEGFVELSMVEESDPVRRWEAVLTEAGFKHIRDSKQTAGNVWAYLRDAWVKGRIELDTISSHEGLNGTGNEPPEPEKKEEKEEAEPAF